jgi:DNA-binding winged helix-turn-helix (wHTH) protein/predicted ATPase
VLIRQWSQKIQPEMVTQPTVSGRRSDFVPPSLLRMVAAQGLLHHNGVVQFPWNFCNVWQRNRRVQRDFQILFPPFRLDAAEGRVWRGSRHIVLRPKSFDLLLYLLDHAGKLLTKETLLGAIWPYTHVSDAVLRGCIREIRQALDDISHAPKFIETVHRRGYRFIAQPQRVLQAQAPSNGRVAARPHTAPVDEPDGCSLTEPAGVVGREGEFAQFQRWLRAALRGERQINFVVGEPGIGKTTVVESFLTTALAQTGAWVGYGQCVEHYGAGEAYMPVLEALGRLCRGAWREQIVPVLEQCAPTWLIQMTALLAASHVEQLERKVRGTSHERMLRELADAVEVLTENQLLVLVIEDLHWADYSTLELISVLARRREPARLLLIGTYRPMDLQPSGHPLRAVEQELLLHGHSEKLPLCFLSESAVAQYLGLRFPRVILPDDLARLVHTRTEGNPLFMVNMVDYLIAQGAIAQVEEKWKLKLDLGKVGLGVPENLRQMIEKQIETLSTDEQRMLEAASVAGMVFSAASVAAALACDIDAVEQRCSALAHRGYLLTQFKDREWPDGTMAACYGFIHQLYQEVLYAQVTAGRRARLHQRIGERQEEAFAGRAGNVAGELAVHFEAGRDYWRAVRYLEQTAENALKRHANREAIGHLTRALELLGRLPDCAERTRRELALQTTLGPALIATKGYTAPEVGAVYDQARQLCYRVSDPAQLRRVLRGLWVLNYMRAELFTARALGEQLLALAEAERDPTLYLEAHYALAATLSCIGEFSGACDHAEQAIALYDPESHCSHTLFYGQDPGVFSLLWASMDLWFLGYPDRALKRSQNMLILAHEAAHPFSLTIALLMAAVLHQLRREPLIAQQHIVTATVVASEQGFPFVLAWGPILQGWVLTARGAKEGVDQMCKGTASLQATDTGWFRPYHLALLAEAYGHIGRPRDGLEVVRKALAESEATGQRFFDAELHRLQGELNFRLKRHGRDLETQGKAQACFMKAIDIARVSGARSLQLRATMSLSRLWHSTGKNKDAHRELAEIYSSFSEGLDTADLREAKALLGRLK